ncbi:MAG: hypothetical protein ACFFD5_15865 [Candidatus Thorarchaeota archaeon]
MSNEEISDFWKKKIKDHKIAFIIMIIAGACAIVGLLLVLFWFIGASPLGGNGTWTFNQWSVGTLLVFCVFLVLFELLFVGVPAALFFGIGYYLWWRRLPTEEKQEFKDREKKETHKKRNWGGGGGFSFFIFLAYCIYLAVDGNFNTAFGTYPYTYWLYTWFLTIMWIVIVLGVPAGIILLIVYFKVWRKK